VKCYRFVDAEKVNHAVALLCRVLEVSRAGFYAWLRRGPSTHALRDAELAKLIRDIHRESRGTYGTPRVHAALAARGVHVSRKRVARLLAAAGLCRPRRVRTTLVDGNAPVAPNLVERDFNPEAPNRLWVADITYVPTGEGWLYLATELDCCARKVVVWSLADHLRSELPLAALSMAISRRRPPRGQLVHHSDRGSQYTSKDFRTELETHGITASMSKHADCYDNAVAESFFATLKSELVHRERWQTRAVAAQAIFEWIEVFYNRQRTHSTLGYRTPEVFEREVMGLSSGPG